LTTKELYLKLLRKKTFFCDRSLGGKLILAELRAAGLSVQSHSVYFRHDTPDVVWLSVVGEKKWIVLTRDAMIGHRTLELDALLAARARVFVLVSSGITDAISAEIIIKALPRIATIIDEARYPFIAKIMKDSSVVIWKTEAATRKGRRR
jgi:hypothetical protein